MAGRVVQALSDTFFEAIRGPHMLATLAIVTPPTGDPVVVDVNDGAVTIDRTADQRRRHR